MSPETVLITGCSSGIGAATAVHLAGRGYRVFASMRAPDTRNAGAAERLLRATPTGGLRVLELDVTDARSIERAVGQIQLEGGLDALVHNAGVAAIGLTEAHSADAAARLFDVNVLGALRVQQATLPLLRESAAPRIVGVSSTLGREQAPFLALYTASKHAFAALLSTWAYELHPEGIRTCLVEPGTFPSTGMLQALLPADRRPPAHTEPLAAPRRPSETASARSVQAPMPPTRTPSRSRSSARWGRGPRTASSSTPPGSTAARASTTWPRPCSGSCSPGMPWATS